MVNGWDGVIESEVGETPDVPYVFVAVVVTPALSLLILPHGRNSAHEPPISRWLKIPYRAVLPWFTRRPTTAIGVLLVSFAGTFLLLRTLGQEFLPNFQETDFLMHFVEKPGTSIEAMRPSMSGTNTDSLNCARVSSAIRWTNPIIAFLSSAPLTSS